MPLGTEVNLSLRDIVLDGHPAPPPLKGHRPQFSANVHCGKTAGWGPSYPGKRAHPIFGPCLLWPNGWMDQDATCYRGCVRWGRSSPLKGAQPPKFSIHIYCGRTAGWMKTPVGTEVHFGPGHIVLDGDVLAVLALRERGTAAPVFSAHVYSGHGRPSQLLLSFCTLFLPHAVNCVRFCFRAVTFCLFVCLYMKYLGNR